MSRQSPFRQRWYRLLLLAYPRAWRHERGAEIRTTLLEASQTQPGQRPPMLRETASLLVGGLRARARLAAGGSVGRLWQDGLHLGALLLLLGQAATALGVQWPSWRGRDPSTPSTRPAHWRCCRSWLR